MAKVAQAVADEDLEGELERLAAPESAQGDPLSRYLEDIRDIPLLTATQEVELAQRIERGDRQAR
jgi:RNA polymerase primary sigma factor